MLPSGAGCCFPIVGYTMGLTDLVLELDPLVVDGLAIDKASLIQLEA